jgi:tetratricopeptide (TPR) repeat protein
MNGVAAAPERIEHWRRAVEADPASAAAHFNLGNALLERGLLARAEGEFRRALELKPGFPEALVNLGGILLTRLDFRGCVEANRKARESRPELLMAHYGEGLGHLYLGEAESMVACFRRAVELDDRHAGSHYHLAVGLLAIGRVDESQAHLRAALEGGFSPAPEFLKALEKAKSGPVTTVTSTKRRGRGLPTKDETQGGKKCPSSPTDPSRSKSTKTASCRSRTSGTRKSPRLSRRRKASTS